MVDLLGNFKSDCGVIVSLSVGNSAAWAEGIKECFSNTAETLTLLLVQSEVSLH